MMWVNEMSVDIDNPVTIAGRAAEICVTIIKKMYSY